MRATLALLAALLVASPAAATQEYILPTLFDVTGVAPDDVLNLRAEPNAGSQILGTLAPDATGVEVVEERRGWARVNLREASGWVSMRYLAYRVDVWEDGRLPAAFSCYGTEPFWSVTARDGALALSTPETPETLLPVTAILGTGVFRDPTRVVLGEGAVLTAVPQQCSDGMSDRRFGLAALLTLTQGEPRLMSGCCSIEARPR